MKGLVKKLYRQFGTTDPFVIALGLRIKVITVPLKDVRGYYHYFQRNHFIYLSNSLSDKESAFICAHELGHYLLHRKINTVFLGSHTCYPRNKFENEANAFAVALLMHEVDITEYEDCCIQKVMLGLGIPHYVISCLGLRHFQNN